jgi:hypothetical protein
MNLLRLLVLRPHRLRAMLLMPKQRVRRIQIFLSLRPSFPFDLLPCDEFDLVVQSALVHGWSLVPDAARCPEEGIASRHGYKHVNQGDIRKIANAQTCDPVRRFVPSSEECTKGTAEHVTCKGLRHWIFLLCRFIGCMRVSKLCKHDLALLCRPLCDESTKDGPTNYSTIQQCRWNAIQNSSTHSR